MTQKQLIQAYIQEFGSILPAKLYGKIYKGVMFGSETSKRCREMRSAGQLRSEEDGKFERFYLEESGYEKAVRIQTKVDEIERKAIDNLILTTMAGVCCYSYQKFSTHDKNCAELSKQKTPNQAATAKLF